MPIEVVCLDQYWIVPVHGATISGPGYGEASDISGLLAVPESRLLLFFRCD